MSPGPAKQSPRSVKKRVKNPIDEPCSKQFKKVDFVLIGISVALALLGALFIYEAWTGQTLGLPAPDSGLVNWICEIFKVIIAVL
jgi:hypothetical protein